ncbi:MAG: 1-acyl-sn-glycerol-3-phosphate acyltransferase [Paludibacteraceae bacterium]|nr:1-acyl-sn-glycerol-3-phosphate acyltransferase [Paludibacteraceae bacterium]
MTKIQDKDRLYLFLRPYVDWVFRRSYRQFRYLGRENIPTDGAVIFAPNHTNALCDAMAILGIDRRQKVFVARADIFRDPKRAKILTWLKIMPISRVRDGLDEVRHNDETINRAVDTLRDGVPFCILPEGTHRPKHSLLPLSKGIFRIALQANEAFGHAKRVYIVPVGLEYGDYYHLWDSLTVNIGQPIDVTQFVSEHAELNAPQLMMALRDELTLRMRRLILWVPDDEHYEENFARLQANPPAPFDRFQPRRLPRWLSIALMVLLSPLFVVCAALTVPLWGMWLFIRNKVQDPAFHNSVQFVWQLVFLTLTLQIPLLFWMFMQEYMYQFRKLKIDN